HVGADRSSGPERHQRGHLGDVLMEVVRHRDRRETGVLGPPHRVGPRPQVERARDLDREADGLLRHVRLLSGNGGGGPAQAKGATTAVPNASSASMASAADPWGGRTRTWVTPTFSK